MSDQERGPRCIACGNFYEQCECPEFNALPQTISFTPRTDAFNTQDKGSLLEFARGLERELAAATGSNIQKPQPELAILDVINALRTVVVVMVKSPSPSSLSHKDGEALLNLLADAEAKLQLP